jgi:hypothetical protein
MSSTRLEEASAAADTLHAASDYRPDVAAANIKNDHWVLGSVALVKAAVLLVVFLTYELLPFNTANFRANFVDPLRRTVSLATAYTTWDGQHYLYLSENGYHAGEISAAFFPLYPLLIHLGGFLTGDNLLAGLIVSNLASLIALYLLFKLVRELHGQRAAENTLLLYLAFPTAFFLCLVYTESLFLLLAVSFFYLLFRGRWGWAAVLAAIIPLARPEGVLIALPSAVFYGIEGLRKGRFGLGHAILVLSPALGALAYLAFMQAATGNAFEMFNAMEHYVSAHSIRYVLRPIQLIQTLTQGPLAIHGFTDSIIDRLFFVAFLLLLVPMFRRLHPALAVFGLAVGILNILSGTFMSYTRYFLLDFPVFIAAGLLLERTGTRPYRLPLACCLSLFQGLFLVMHALSYWIA